MVKNINHLTFSFLKRHFPITRVRKAFLSLTGTSRNELARKLGVTGPAITQTLSGHRTNFRTQYAIAKELDVPVEELFPPEAA